jgi:AraC-like DNA-binding protein
MIQLFEITIFGSLVLLSFLLISNPFKVNDKANKWLGIFTLLWSSFWLEEILLLAFNQVVKVESIPSLSVVQFMSPIPFYLSIRYFTNPNHALNRKHWLLVAVPIIYLLVLIINQRTSVNILPIRIGILLLHSLFYVAVSYHLIRKHQKHIQQFSSNTQGIDLYWLEYIIIGMLILTLFIIGFNLFFYNNPLNLFMNGVTLVIVFFTAYNSLKQKEIYSLDEQERNEMISVGEDEQVDMLKRQLLSEERLEELKVRLNELMVRDEPYLYSNLNLINLAKELHITSHQLSYLINKGFSENFYSYINKFRIEKAKKLLLDNEANKFSIIGIAFESGFSSKTSFNTTFKKMTGYTPSEFKKRSSDL